ncbi:MAG: T9SS type A sorting domain-containing protein [Paludibacter sp.]
MRKKLLGIFTILYMLCSFQLSAQIIVNSTADGSNRQVLDWAVTGKITLRYAICGNWSRSVITFDPSIANQTIKLTNGTIQFTPNTVTTLLIDGENNNITIDGDNLYQIFNVSDGIQWGANSTINITLRKLKFINGKSDYGGAIRNQENLVIEDCVFKNNNANLITTNFGGAIFHEKSEAGFLTLNRCLFKNNNCAGHGGAICIDEQGWTKAKITNCSFIGNSASWDGGAIRAAWCSNVFVLNSTFIENIASVNDGPAIKILQLNFTQGGNLFVNNKSNESTPTLQDVNFNAPTSYSDLGFNAYTSADSTVWTNATDKQLTYPTNTITTDASVGGYVLTIGGDVDTRNVPDSYITTNNVIVDINNQNRQSKSFYNSGAKEFVSISSFYPAIQSSSFKPYFNGDKLCLNNACKSIEIYNINGIKVLIDQNTQIVNAAGLTKGVYLLKIDKEVAIKIVKL